eukprot:355645-Chlamydomonas_euryale.AAC.15
MSEPLGLNSVVGFGGGIENGLVVHPDGRTLIYPLGSTIVLRDKNDPRAQEFLQGHSDKVSCLALSKSGRYLASGQITYMGFTADIIIWDLETRQLMHRMALHKVRTAMPGRLSIDTGGDVCGKAYHSVSCQCFPERPWKRLCRSFTDGTSTANRGDMPSIPNCVGMFAQHMHRTQTWRAHYTITSQTHAMHGLLCTLLQPAMDNSGPVKIQALDFSCDERYLASLGGQDDNALVRCLYDNVLWDVETGRAICGSPAHTNFSLTVKFFNNANDRLVTGGNYNLRVWEYDLSNNKLRPTEAQLGQMQRIIKTITVDHRDDFMYCGTSTGDVLQTRGACSGMVCIYPLLLPYLVAEPGILSDWNSSKGRPTYPLVADCA